MDCVLPLGKIIGHVDLLDIRRTEKVVSTLSDVEAGYGDYSPGRYAWLTTDPELLSHPVAASGHLGIWRYRCDGNQE